MYPIVVVIIMIQTSGIINWNGRFVY